MMKEMRAHYRAELRQVEKKISRENQSNEQKREQPAGTEPTRKKQIGSNLALHATHPTHSKLGKAAFVQVGCPFVLVTARNTADAP